MRHLILQLVFLALAHAGLSQNKWETAIRAFEKTDQQTPPPKSPIVFVGSSSFTLWKDVTATFPDKPILNRGFGGSQLSDALLLADRIILAYRPKQVIIYAGDNDLAVGKTPKQVHHLFVELFQKLRQAQPDMAVAFVAIKPSPVRWKFKSKMDQTNRLIRRYIRRQTNADFVDVVPVMLDPVSQYPIAQLFKPDSLHMNAEGYKRWAILIKPILR